MTDQAYIKEVRKALGLTQEEMGNKIDMTQKTISGWESGRNEIPYITLLVYERFADDNNIELDKPKQLRDKN